MYSDGSSLYAFARNSPNSLRDPFGLSVTVTGPVIGEFNLSQRGKVVPGSDAAYVQAVMTWKGTPPTFDCDCQMVTEVNISWDVTDLLTGAVVHGYYHYFVKGSPAPEVSVNLGRGHGQGGGEKTIDQVKARAHSVDVSMTQGVIHVDFIYKCVCDCLGNWNKPMPEQGRPTETNSPDGHPNRMRSPVRDHFEWREEPPIGWWDETCGGSEETGEIFTWKLPKSVNGSTEQEIKNAFEHNP
jgi:hypothetical protein